MKKRIRLISLILVMILSMTLLAACGMNSKKGVAVTINDEDIYLNEAMYYIYTVEANFGMMVSLEYWDTVVDEELTFADTTKEYVMNGLIDMHVLAKEGEKADIKITPDIETQLKSRAVELYNSMSEEVVKITGLNEKAIYEVVAKNYIGSIHQNNMMAELDIDVEEIAAEYDKEELRQYNTEYLKFPFVSLDEEGNEVELTDDEKAAAKVTLEALLTETQEGKAFKDIAEANEGIANSTSNFLADSETMDVNYKEAALNLANDEITDQVIEADNGYYIIKMVNDNSDEAYNSTVNNAISQKQQELFQEKLDGIKESYTITINDEVWDTVKLGRTTINLDAPETEETEETK